MDHSNENRESQLEPIEDELAAQASGGYRSNPMVPDYVYYSVCSACGARYDSRVEKCSCGCDKMLIGRAPSKWQ